MNNFKDKLKYICDSNVTGELLNKNQFAYQYNPHSKVVQKDKNHPITNIEEKKT